MKSLSLAAQNAYLDLKRSLMDESISNIIGTPKTKIVRGRTYWYDQFRLGNSLKEVYIGEDNEELRSRLSRVEELRGEKAIRQQNRARLVRHIRSENVLSVDSSTGSLLAAFERSGVFRLGGTLVGTTAFRLYESELGVRFGGEIAQTQDIDIASFERLSVVLDDVVEPNLQAVFKDLQFEGLPTTEKNKVWRWRQTRGDVLVEFLTPSFEEGEPIKRLEALGVEAQSLHFLNFLIAEPIKAAVPYRSGILIQIPQPARYAIHKLIISERRTDTRLKSSKDRQQAALLIEALRLDYSEDLKDAYQIAVESGEKWRQLLSNALEKVPATRKILNEITT